MSASTKRNGSSPEFHSSEIEGSADTRKKSNAGRKPLPAEEKKIDSGIFATKGDIDYLLTWNSGSTSLAFSELVACLRKVHPTGRFSAPRVPPGGRLKPGTKTWLKARIRALEKQLAANGITPEPEPKPVSDEPAC